MGAEWQRGFDLDYLKQFGALFKDAHKPLVFGAFGLTKERDVADYLARDRAIWTGAPPQAVALFSVAKAASEQHDYAQRAIPIGQGAVVVRSFAARAAEAGAKVLSALVARSEGRAVWLEIFEEDPAARAAAAAAGFSYVATKISAGSEIKGLYCLGIEPPVPPLGAAERAALLVLKPEFLSKPEAAAIRAEVAAYESAFAQHYSDYNKRKSWTAFALRGYQDDPGFIIKPAEMSKSWKEEHPELMKAKPRWTSVADAFPATRKAIGRLGVEFDRVRFMRLRAKDGELSRHADITDRSAGVADGMLARLHVPISTSDAVTFYGWGDRGERLAYQFKERSLFYLDQRKPHAVTNTDPALDRVHLVMDCVSGPKLRKLIEAAA